VCSKHNVELKISANCNLLSILKLYRLPARENAVRKKEKIFRSPSENLFESFYAKMQK